MAMALVAMSGGALLRSTRTLVLVVVMGIAMLLLERSGIFDLGGFLDGGLC